MKIRARSQHRRYPYWYEGFYLNPPNKPGEYPCVLSSIGDKRDAVNMYRKQALSIHVMTDMYKISCFLYMLRLICIEK